MARASESAGAAEGARRSPAWVKPAVFCALLLALAAISYASGAAEGLSSIAQWEALEVLVERNLAAALAVYFACTVVGAALLMVPGVVFALAAGMLFGPVVGSAACSVSTTAGAVAAFLVGRFFLRDAIRPWVCRNRHVKRWLFEETGLNALVLLMITRLVPLFPYNVQNFAYGITDMKLGVYALCSFVFMLPGTVMYVLIGAGLADGAGSAWLIAVSAAIAAVTFAVAGILKRRFHIEEPAAGGQDDGGEPAALPDGEDAPSAHVGACEASCSSCTGASLPHAGSSSREKGPMSLSTRLTVWEKRGYKWKNWRHAGSGAVFFPGCALPSFFPQTERALSRLLDEQAGMGCALDCCGKALENPLGAAEMQAQVARVEAGCARCGATELVTACPNCFATFSTGAATGAVGVYRVLAELGVAAQGAPCGVVFVPCPDRRERAWLADVRRLLGSGVEVLDTALCCGAAFANERPQAAQQAARGVLRSACEACEARGVPPVLYVYCASCAGQLERARLAGTKEGDGRLARLRVVHVLSAVVGVQEAPAVGASILNRAKAALR